MARRSCAVGGLGVVLALALGGGCSGTRDGDRADPDARTSTAAASPTAASPTPGGGDPAARRPLAGRVVVLDPGHQLGNRRFGAQVAAPVDAGGFRKACNTTGTASAAGLPEATLNWRVARVVRAQLRRLGARVLMTRTANRDDAWGPCVDERGRIGNPGEPGPTADLRLSIHADGVLADGAHGFHVIRPGVRPGWTDDIVRPSRRLAERVRDALLDAGFAPSTYRGRDGVDVRTDLGTLNHSDVPAVLVELGNMRDDEEAAVLASAAGQRRYGRALAAAVRDHLTG